MTKITDYKTRISEQDKIIFNELNSFLGNYNDEQKKAIISDAPKILCIAGAGSGKTTVLTKKIEFLVKYKGVNPQKILAITFTRKAKQEMQKRLNSLGINTHIYTFNSFSERVLKLYGYKIYSQPTRTIGYGNKVMMLLSALNSMNLTVNQATDKYYTEFQKINKSPEQISSSFMNDCFSVLEYFKRKNKEIYDFSGNGTSQKHQENARMIYQICKNINQQMKLTGLRDFTDQILDTINLFEQFPNLIPKFDYVLIDEYQDVNSIQIQLVDLLNPKNLFCVGDPRQSIFGWRGSDIKYILNFKEKYPEAEIISLTKNYRSNNHIVNFINHSIKHMELSDLEHSIEKQKQIFFKSFESVDEEYNYVLEELTSSNIPPNEIFVLARTNRQLNELSQKLHQKNIPHVIKTEETNKQTFEEQKGIILATIHAIKGLEAKKVFIIGCNEQNFPCKASDHPVVDIIKTEEYDKEAEEKRLFYVALSRAKDELYLTYSGKKPTYFITTDMLNMIDDKPKEEVKEKYIDLTKDKPKEIENDFYDTSKKERGEDNIRKSDVVFDGSSYSSEYNPYKGEDWDNMVSD